MKTRPVSYAFQDSSELCSLLAVLRTEAEMQSADLEKIRYQAFAISGASSAIADSRPSISASVWLALHWIRRTPPR
jgi:hypothetical protein